MSVLLARRLVQLSSLISHTQALGMPKRANRYNDRYHRTKIRECIFELLNANLIEQVPAQYWWGRDNNYTYQLTFEGWVASCEHERR